MALCRAHVWRKKMIGPDTPPSDASAACAEPAGFWRRVVAVAIDVAVVATMGRVLGMLWFDTLATLGQHGLALGAGVLLAYFGLLASRIGGGATLGKRALSLRVVDRDGRLLNPGVAVARASVVVVPWVLVQLTVPPGVFATLHGWAAWAAVSLLGWCVYLFLFNTPSRRSLPDLVAGTTVVRVPADRRTVIPTAPDSVWPGHYLVCALALGLFLAGRTMLPNPALDDSDHERIEDVRAALQEQLGTVRVGTHLGYALSWRVALLPGIGEEAQLGTARFVTVTVGLAGEPKSYDSVVDRVALTLLSLFPEAFERDSIEITVLYGFDIGIAERWIGHTIGLDPESWRERIGARSVPA